MKKICLLVITHMRTLLLVTVVPGGIAAISSEGGGAPRGCMVGRTGGVGHRAWPNKGVFFYLHKTIFRAPLAPDRKGKTQFLPPTVGQTGAELGAGTRGPIADRSRRDCRYSLATLNTAPHWREPLSPPE